MTPKTWAASVLGVEPDTLTEEALLGDASTRSYLRLRGESDSWVVMMLADRKGAYVSEEQGAAQSDELPYLAMTRFLSEGGWPVPKLIHFDDERGWLLLEDFGDVHLAHVVEAGESTAIDRCYEQALDLLVDLHWGLGPKLEPWVPASHLHNDEATLRWELEHYVEYGLGTKLGRELEPDDAGTLASSLDSIAAELAQAPRVLSHRDYHSRNILLRGDQTLGVIDFQDAFLATPAYDLASLLLDSYVDLGWERVDRLVTRFHGQLSEADPSLASHMGSLDAWRRLFELQGLQRNLKAAGRFVFIKEVKGSDRYMAAIPQTLAKVRRNLARHRDLAPLQRILSRYEPRLAPDSTAP